MARVYATLDSVVSTATHAAPIFSHANRVRVAMFTAIHRQRVMVMASATLLVSVTVTLASPYAMELLAAYLLHTPSFPSFVAIPVSCWRILTGAKISVRLTQALHHTKGKSSTGVGVGVGGQRITPCTNLSTTGWATRLRMVRILGTAQCRSAVTKVVQSFKPQNPLDHLVQSRAPVAASVPTKVTEPCALAEELMVTTRCFSLSVPPLAQARKHNTVVPRGTSLFKLWRQRSCVARM